MKIAFCSCSKHHREPDGHGWSSILAENPDLLLLLGDLVYAPSWKWKWRKAKRQKALAKLEARYRGQFGREDFRELIQRTPYAATWDDHDFAWNNVCGSRVAPTIRSGTLELFNRFHSERIQPVANRVRQSFVPEADASVRVILLDVRSYREKPKKKRSMLGKEQLAWLKTELEKPEEIAVVAAGSCLTAGGSRWAKFRREYDEVIGWFSARRRVLFLGGDVHENGFVPGDGYHELISSGVGRHALGNFGVVDIGSSEIDVRLTGRRERDRLRRTIDRSTWTVSG